MIQLRPYQREAVDSIFSYFAEREGHPVVAMPTGTGKSIVIADFLRRVMAYPDQRVMILTHVKELLVQNAQKLLQIWPTAPAGIYSAGLGMREVRPITFAGIASVVKKAVLFGHVDLVIIDECHLVSPKSESMYRKFLSGLAMCNPALRVIGLSATPYRMGHGMITDGDGLFTDICFDNTRSSDFIQLIQQGYLSMLIPKATTSELDVSGVRMSGGEFVQKALQQAVDKEMVTREALIEAATLAADRAHWLVFATGIDHAEHIKQELQGMGITAEAVHSRMPSTRRQQVLGGFRAGSIRALVNNNVLTTGFDFPEIDCIVMLRPTASTGLWVQMLGRGTRPAPGKHNCLVLDFAANTRRLGPINEPNLPKRKRKGKGGQAPVRICENCGCYNHASARVCTFCGAEFPRQVKIGAVAAGDALIVDDAPLVEKFTINTIVYSKHVPRDARPPSMKVTYNCGLRMFSEWVCFEHKGYALRKAHNWWAERNGDDPYPETIDDALARTEDLITPCALRVWVNRKHPQIMGAEFGVASVDTRVDGIDDDDIPF